MIGWMHAATGVRVVFSFFDADKKNERTRVGLRRVCWTGCNGFN
jgi:hypothetical protein